MKNINVGMVVNTHALKGDVKVKVYSDFPQLRFAKKAKLYIHINNEEKELQVEHARLQKDMLIVKFKGFDDINEVEAWKGHLLYIHEDQLHELMEDEAYYYELMDSVVYDLNEEEVGRVVEVIETGANAVLRVQKEDEEVLIPFVKAFVKDFDKLNKCMHVDMEGL